MNPFLSLLLTLVAFVVVMPSAGAAQVQLSPAARLRKLSLALRGTIPTREEYLEVNQLPIERHDTFFAEKAFSYIQTNSYVEKMRERLQTLYRIRPASAIRLKNSPEDEYSIYNENAFNSLDQIFLDIVRNNLSWDELLTRKTYRVYDYNEVNFENLGFISDAGFFKGVFPDQIGETSDGAMSAMMPRLTTQSLAPKGIEVEARSENEKLVTAGTLTTSRFFARYQTTKLNRNRARAAAIFRIFLCDDMRPVVIPNANEDLERLALSFNDDGEHGFEMTEAEQRHGSDPACQACHYKLDPVADTFRTSSVVLNPVPAKGALTFTREDGTRVNIPVRGIGELANVIVSQPEYAQCPVQHFWNWFIGKDVPLTKARRDELVEQFNSLNRRPNDFIPYLVSQPEFRNIPNSIDRIITLTHVRPIFKQCHSCHEKEGYIPPFDRSPIGGDLSAHEETLLKITEALD